MRSYSKLCIMAIGAYIFAGCANEKGAEKQEKIIPVKVMEIAASQTASVRNYIGMVEESVAVSLAFSSMGTIEQVFVLEGQRVQKGQLLAKLNTATAEDSYQMMLSKLQQAQDAYDRLAKLHEKGSIPEIQFVEVATGLQQAKSMTSVSKKNLDDCQLFAPRDGVIASRSVEIGSNVMPGVAAFKLVSINKVNVKIPVPEGEIGKIAKGQKALIEVPALNDSVFIGEVDTKGVAANVISHTYDVKISVDNPLMKLMPGMVCKVVVQSPEITGEAISAKITVPNRTIQISTDGRQFVWLADDNTAKRKFVKTDGINDDGIVVTDGLSTGDKLIVEGFQKISEGMKISF